MTATTHRADGEVQLLRVLAVAILALCASVSLVSLLEHLISGWRGHYLVILCCLAVVEGYVAQRNRSRLPGIGPLPGWALEPLALFVIVQLAIDLSVGQAPIKQGVPVLELRALLQSVPVILAWMAGGATAQDFADVDAGPEEGVTRTPMRRLPLRLLAVGAMTFLFAGMTEARVAAALHLPDTSSGPLIQVVVYFLLAAVLLAHASYATQRGRWRYNAVQVSSLLVNRWAAYSAAFLGLVAVAAFVLQYTHPLSAAGGVGATALSQTESWLIDFLRRFAGGWLHIKPRSVPRTIPPPGLHLPPPRHVTHHTGHGGGNAAGPAIQAIAFWLLVLAAIAFTVRSIGRRAHRRLRLPRLTLPATLVRLLAGLRSWFGRRAGTLSLRLPGGVRPPSALANVFAGGPGFLHRGPRTARGRVLWYYARTSKRLGQNGLPRGGSQTPREYEAVVGIGLTEAQPDMHRLTETFLVARYSGHEVADSDAEVARTAWGRIRDAVRRFRG